jgi:hypothetical protein
MVPTPGPRYISVISVVILDCWGKRVEAKKKKEGPLYWFDKQYLHIKKIVYQRSIIREKNQKSIQAMEIDLR